MTRAFIFTVSADSQVEVREASDGTVALAIVNGNELHRVWMTKKAFEELCDLRYTIKWSEGEEK